MKTKLTILGALLLTALFFGCTETVQPEANEQELMNEIDSTWVNENELDIDNPIATEADSASSEAENDLIGENEEVTIGEMI